LKKHFLVFLVVIIFLFSSCSGIENKTSASPLKSVEFTVLYNEKEELPFRSDWTILEEYKNIKNVSLKIFTGDDSSYIDSVEEYITSPNPPDIILKCYPGEITNYINSGLVLPISDYIEKMPHFQKYMTENNLWDLVDDLRLSNGKFYILPGFQRQTQVQQWIYRADVFRDNGLEVPETYNDLYESLKFLKNKYPEGSNISASWGGAHLFAMMGAGYGINAGWAGFQSFDSKSNTWFFTPASENYREMLTYLNKCYDAGILDPDIFTQTNEEFISKLLNNKSFVTVTWISSGFDNWNKTLETNGFPGAEWAPLAVPESTIGISALPAVNQFRKGLVISASAAEKNYFDELLSFIDWAVYSDEGMTLTTWGIEGFTYEEDSSGKSYLPFVEFPGNENGSINITAEYGFNTLFDLNENNEFADSKKPDYIVDFLEASIARGDINGPLPSLLLTDNESEVTHIIIDNMSNYLNESTIDFITGDLDPIKDWNNHINELEKRGLKVLENTWNTAWERVNAD